ncbi:uncharacterized protein EI90DRAFT_3117337 [Cantharellus anzutake]|uniref:uncharacterized protein n=1 Tax=Cantharellus anzutake TaxID=1750568 RepID=UPI001903B62F|nr:uncharacterized protein EI90DRAFT_3117337 [Cantharellus anzutake]KAF8339513.1 hypothetical protein EI90DRAFT_3117337 [Cantharellus anzutake]
MQVDVPSSNPRPLPQPGCHLSHQVPVLRMIQPHSIPFTSWHCLTTPLEDKHFQAFGKADLDVWAAPLFEVHGVYAVAQAKASKSALKYGKTRIAILAKHHDVLDRVAQLISENNAHYHALLAFAIFSPLDPFSGKEVASYSWVSKVDLHFMGCVWESVPFEELCSRLLADAPLVLTNDNVGEELLYHGFDLLVSTEAQAALRNVKLHSFDFSPHVLNAWYDTMPLQFKSYGVTPFMFVACAYDSALFKGRKAFMAEIWRTESVIDAALRNLMEYLCKNSQDVICRESKEKTESFQYLRGQRKWRLTVDTAIKDYCPYFKVKPGTLLPRPTVNPVYQSPPILQDPSTPPPSRVPTSPDADSDVPLADQQGAELLFIREEVPGANADELGDTVASDLAGLTAMDTDEDSLEPVDTESGTSGIIGLRGGPLTVNQREIIQKLVNQHISTLIDYAKQWKKSPDLEYDDHMKDLGGKTSPGWKAWASGVIEQQNESNKGILQRLASDPHVQAKNMNLYMSRIAKDLAWARPNGIHMALVVISTTDHPVMHSANGVITNSRAIEAFFKSLSGSNTILIKRMREFIANHDGVSEGPQGGTFHPPPTPKTHDECRSSLRLHLVEHLPSSIMGANPMDKKFPWGQLPAKLLQAHSCLTQWPDDKMFNYYKLFKEHSVKLVSDGVFKALWWQIMKLPPDQRPKVCPLTVQDDQAAVISSVSGATLVSVSQAQHPMWTHAGPIRDEDVEMDEMPTSVPSTSMPRKRSATDPVGRPAPNE